MSTPLDLRIARYDTSGAQLSSGASAGATSISVATTKGPLWQQITASTGTFPSSTFFDDFGYTLGPASAVLDPAMYQLYDSVGNAGFGLRKPSQITIVSSSDPSNSKSLRIRAQNQGGALWSGGMSVFGIPHTYGQWETYMSGSDDASAVTSPVVLHWSVAEQWPRFGELDWIENFNPATRSTRTPVEWNIHRLNPLATPPYDASDDQFIGGTYAAIDMSVGHKYTFSWTPWDMVMDIDNGALITTLTNNPAYIPDWPMSLRLQLDAWSNTPPASPVDMEFRYLLYRPWVAPPDAYDILVGGQRVTCLGVSGSSSPQTFTISPLPRAAASGARVALADPAYYEL